MVKAIPQAVEDGDGNIVHIEKWKMPVQSIKNVIKKYVIVRNEVMS